MSFREKAAWLAIVAIAITYGPYFTYAVLRPAGDSLPNFGQLRLFALTSLSQAALLGLGRFVLSRRSPEEARVRPDERDRAIEHRSLRFGYYVLMAAMILVGVVMPFTSGGWSIVNAALLGIVIAELVVYGATVASYARQR